jgi:hypothetical protein
MFAFPGGGAFHQRHQKRQANGQHRKNQKRVEVSKGRCLLLAQVLQRLQSHLVCPNGISGLLEERWLNLREIRIHRRIQLIEILVETQRMEYLATLGNSLD